MDETQVCLIALIGVGLAIACTVILFQRFVIREQRRMLREAGNTVSKGDAMLASCERQRDEFRGMLERVRAERLEDLAGAVRGLIAFLQARARELDHEDDWWRHGRHPYDDEPDA